MKISKVNLDLDLDSILFKLPKDKMHNGGGMHSADQRTTFVSSISVRDAKPPPIPPSMLGNNVGLVGAHSPGSIHWQTGGVKSISTMPMSTVLPNLPDSRNVMIGGTRFPAPKAALINSPGRPNHGQSHQIAVQYHQVYQSANASSNYSSPRSSIGSGGGDSKNSSPRNSLTNPAYYEQKFGSPKASLTIASPRTNLNTQSLSIVGGIDSRHTNPRARSVPLLSENRFNEPAPPHIYTDPRQRTMSPQSQVAVSVQSNSFINNQIPNQTHNGHGVNVPINVVSRNGATVSSSFNTSQINNAGSSSAGSSQSTPPSIPARVPLKRLSVSDSDAERAVNALTEQLERDLSSGISGLSFTSSKKAVESTAGELEPPPPYHGPHDVQTAVKVGASTPPTSAQPKPNIRLVAPVQGIQVQTGSLSPSGPSSLLSPGLKPTLAFQVTPPKSKGPSDAERKLAALTQQLEDEMDQAADYFGELVKK